LRLLLRLYLRLPANDPECCLLEYP
jgi:hypothetical protein